MTFFVKRGIKMTGFIHQNVRIMQAIFIRINNARKLFFEGPLVVESFFEGSL